MTAAIVQFQKKEEAKFLCSACGAERGCNCNAPAVERIAELKEKERVKKAKYRAKTSKNNHRVHGTGNDVDTEASAEKRKRDVALDRDAEKAADPLVIPGSRYQDEILPSPWFKSKIKPIIKGSIVNDPVASAAALREFKAACASFLPLMTDKDLNAAQNVLWVVEDLRNEVEEEARKAKEAVAKAKRIKWEDKHPEKAKAQAREDAQAEAMSVDMEDGKSEARENGERWGDVKDERVSEWIETNWDDKKEAEFEAVFQKRWNADRVKVAA